MKLFEQIASMKLHGWCSVEKAQTLAAAIIAYRPEVVLEIGIFGGSSFIPMALAIKEIGKGAVWGIDPWRAAASVEGQVKPEDQQYWSDQNRHDMVYNSFMGAVSHYGLQNIVKIQRCTSDEAEVPEGIGLLHLDGNHGEQALKDVVRFAPKCVTGSLLFADDENWSGGGVLRAIAKLKFMGWRELYKLDTGVMLQRL